MPTKYYIDINGNYIGGFEGDTGVDLSDYVEITAPPPVSATQTTMDNGVTWSDPA